MQPALSAVVTGPGGLRGTILTTSCPAGDTASQVAIKLDDGRVLVVPENQLILKADDTYYLPVEPGGLRSEPHMASAGAAVSIETDAPRPSVVGRGGDRATGAAAAAGAGPDEVRIPRVEERLTVGKAEVERTVRVRKTVQEREEVVDQALLRERVDVERVAVNRVVQAAPEVRQEGDVTIIPVLEEVLVVEKRLMLREELRVTRRRTEVREPQTVTLRSEQVHVERGEPGGRGGEPAMNRT